MTVPPPWPSEAVHRTQEVRDRYRQYVLATHADPPADASTSNSGLVMIVLGVFCCMSLVGLPLGIHLLSRGIRRTSRSSQPSQAKAMTHLAEARLAWAERAEFVMAYLLMVNKLLQQPGNLTLSGLFIISFEPGPPSTIGFMANVAIKAMTGGDDTTPPEDRAFLEQLMKDEQYTPHRRRQLPMSITNGHSICAVDLMVTQNYLPGNHISDEIPFVPCLAEPRRPAWDRAHSV